MTTVLLLLWIAIAIAGLSRATPNVRNSLKDLSAISRIPEPNGRRIIAWSLLWTNAVILVAMFVCLMLGTTVLVAVTFGGTIRLEGGAGTLVVVLLFTGETVGAVLPWRIGHARWQVRQWYDGGE